MPVATCSGYGSPSEDFELSQAPVHKTVTGDEPEQARITSGAPFRSRIVSVQRPTCPDALL